MTVYLSESLHLQVMPYRKGKYIFKADYKADFEDKMNTFIQRYYKTLPFTWYYIEVNKRYYTEVNILFCFGIEI